MIKTNDNESSSCIYTRTGDVECIHTSGSAREPDLPRTPTIAGLIPVTSIDRDLAAVPATAWMALAGQAIVSTTVAFIYYYRLIADIGPVKASTVTLLVPVFGMIWGVLFLGEPLTPGRVTGCGIILLGCALILGLVRVPWRQRAA